MMRKRTILALGLLAAAGSANAQLLVGYDASGDNAWNVDPASGSAALLWSGFEVWGMAYDHTTNTVYANDGSTLGFGDLGSGAPGNTVTITDDTGARLSMVSLAWADGALYGTRNVGEEAIYRIDPDTGIATIVFDYDDDLYDFGGLAFNMDDGLFYGTNDDSDGRGLYAIDAFGSGTISLVTPYPDGETDIDGLAIGEGVAYLVEDEAGDTIHPFDLNAGVYLTDITSPMTTSAVFSGAAYVVPAPAGLALLGLGGLVATRRRR